jgi:hypothetical protein
MGLDLVELVLDVEQSFGISLDDDDVAQIVSVGQFYDLVVRKTSGIRSPNCPTAKAFYRLRQSLVSVPRIARSKIRPSTPMSALLPHWHRLRVWKRLEIDLGLKIPPLVNQAGTSIAWGLGIAVPASFLVTAVGTGDLLAAFAASLFSLLPAVLFGYIFGILFLPPVPYPQHRTVGGLAKGIVAYNYDQFVAPPPATPENDEAWNKLCQIIVNQLGVKRERLHRETQFVKDLGC